jgi:hypothetical protein
MKKMQFKMPKKSTLATILGTAFMLSACSGGGGGGDGTNNGANNGGDTNSPATTISGTAASGTPIVGKVVAIDATGKSFSATTSALGAYTINVAGGTAPFILTITGTSGGITTTLNSVATAAGQTVNITPLTDLIVSIAAGQPSATLVGLCSPTAQPGCTSALTKATTGTNLSAAVTAVKNMIAPLNAAGTDPLNGAFAADGTGMDAVLDKILVTPAAAQGAMATVTLIAVPGQNLGTVTMPPVAGGTSTPATVTPPAASLTAATTAAATLEEIRTCMTSLSALYPANMTVAPTAAQITPFFDATFSNGGGSQADAVVGFSTLPTATGGANEGMAIPGLTFTARGFSPFDFTPQPSGSLLTGTSAVSATTAWISVNLSSSAFDEFGSFKMLKGAAYAGCPGGWKMVGSGHFYMHMNARVGKGTYNNVTTYDRGMAMHMQTSTATTAGVNSIVVSGPGLSVYSGNTASPVGAAQSITLVMPPVPAAPAVPVTWMVMQGQGNINNSFYGTREEIQSCQDLTATSAPAGTPCYDDSAVAPGAVFKWTVYGPAGVLYAFPYQIHAVPLSKAFALANDTDLFPQNISATPNGIAALNAAAAGAATGAPLDGIIKYTYTQSTVYGARTDNCGIYLSNATNLIMLAEQNAAGLPTQQTSCTFTTAGLNSGSLAKPSVPFVSGTMSIGNQVLGNAVGSGHSF